MRILILTALLATFAISAFAQGRSCQTSCSNVTGSGAGYQCVTRCN